MISGSTKINGHMVQGLRIHYLFQSMISVLASQIDVQLSSQLSSISLLTKTNIYTVLSNWTNITDFLSMICQKRYVTTTKFHITKFDVVLEIVYIYIYIYIYININLYSNYGIFQIGQISMLFCPLPISPP